jgi:hypothetical protein
MHSHTAAGVDRTENTASDSSYIVAYLNVATLTWYLLYRNLVTDISSG